MECAWTGLFIHHPWQGRDLQQNKTRFYEALAQPVTYPTTSTVLTLK